MTNNNELNQGADADALNGLPEKELKETKDILDELDKESAPKPGDDKKPDDSTKPEVKTEEKPETVKTDEEKAKEEADGKKPEQRRETKLMPAWLHERSKAAWEKRETELLALVESSKGTVIKPEENKPIEGDLKKEAEILAEKHGITVELAEELVAIRASNSNGKLPPEIEAKLKIVDEMQNAATITAEATAFNADFDRIVMPLIKAEYGNNVPATLIDQVREELKAKAYTPEYAKVPYTVLYKGEDQFRGIIAPERKGAEGGRGGTNAQQEIAGQGTTIDLTKPLTDEELKSLTNEQFDQYEKNMENHERSLKK